MTQYGNEINVLSAILQNMPTANRIDSLYAKGLKNTTKDIKKTNFVSGQTGAQEYIKAMAGALGLGGAGNDVSDTLAPSSPNSLIDRIMGQNAVSLFNASENTRVQNASAQRNDYLMKLAQFLDASGISAGTQRRTGDLNTGNLTQDQLRTLVQGTWSRGLHGATANGGLPNFTTVNNKQSG